MKNLTEKIRGPRGDIWSIWENIDLAIENAGFSWSQLYNEFTDSSCINNISRHIHMYRWEIYENLL